MHNEAANIVAGVVIRNRKVYKDGKLVFSGTATDVAGFFNEVYDYLAPGYPKFYKMDNVAKLGWLASEVLLKDSFDKSAFTPDDTGIVLSNSNSSLDTDRKYFKTVSEFASPSLFVYTLPNIVIGEISIRNQFRGENAFFIFKKFDPLFLEQYVGSLLKNGVVKNCICGWVDALENEYEAILFLVQRSGETEFTSVNMIKLAEV